MEQVLNDNLSLCDITRPFTHHHDFTNHTSSFLEAKNVDIKESIINNRICLYNIMISHFWQNSTTVSHPFHRLWFKKLRIKELYTVVVVCSSSLFFNQSGSLLLLITIVCHWTITNGMIMPRLGYKSASFSGIIISTQLSVLLFTLKKLSLICSHLDNVSSKTCINVNYVMIGVLVVRCIIFKTKEMKEWMLVIKDCTRKLYSLTANNWQVQSQRN